jgi:hypothetical protein
VKWNASAAANVILILSAVMGPSGSFGNREKTETYFNVLSESSQLP